MSAHIIGSWFKGDDWAHTNVVASSTWSSAEGSSAELILSRPSLLHLHGEKHSLELAECSLVQTPQRQILPQQQDAGKSDHTEMSSRASRSLFLGWTGSGGCGQALEHRPSPPYLLLPQARIWFFTVRTMEESMPQMTL